MSRVVVTGGAGFIGSHVCDLLVRHGHEVVAADNLSTGRAENLAGSAVRLEQVDIRTSGFAGLVAEFRPERVVHLAAQASVTASVADPAADADVNVIGLIKVLEACLFAGVEKVLFASSGGTIYGPLVSGPFKETDGAGVWPASPYGLTKKMAEGYLRLFRERGLDSTSLALANVFGPRQDPFGESGVIAIFANHLISGTPCTIFGDGLQTRDFVFVSDVAEAFRMALDAGSGQLLNIGTGQETSVVELYAAMAGLEGVVEPATHEPERPGELRRNVLDASLAAEVLGWRPEVELLEGLELTIAAFRP